MAKRLSEFLKEIGQEVSNSTYVDEHCTIRSITKDEALAREIWKRALGYEEEIRISDTETRHRIFLPDAKAQEFIFERREGKAGMPMDARTTTLLEKITELTKDNMNKMAEDAAKNGHDNNPNS